MKKILCMLGLHKLIYFYKDYMTLVVICERCEYEEEEWYSGRINNVSDKTKSL